MPGDPRGLFDSGRGRVHVAEATMERYGEPEHLRSDNGPEFIAHGNCGLVERKERVTATYQEYPEFNLCTLTEVITI